MRVDNQTISLDPFLIQVSPNGREFKVVAIEKDLTMDPEWVNETLKFHWIVTIKFLDNNKRVRLYFDYKDQCIKKVKFQFGNL